MSERYDFDLMKQLMAKDNGGEWVRYSDYAALEAKLAALPKPDMVSMSEGTIHLDYEDDDARQDAYEWLERYAYSSAPEAQEEPHEVLHVYDGDGGVIIRENGNISTFGAQTPAVHAAFEAASDAEAQQEPPRPSEQAVTEAGVEASARIIAKWLGYSWDGLLDGRVTDKGFPVFTHGQFGWGFQGRKGDMIDLARAALKAAMEDVT